MGVGRCRGLHAPTTGATAFQISAATASGDGVASMTRTRFGSRRAISR
jgi:hypothetical protein